MKKLNKSWLVALPLSFMVACGGGGSESENSENETKNEETTSKKTGKFKLDVEEKMAGPMGKYFIVTKAVLNITEDALGTKLMVEIKRTSKEFDFDANNVDVCGVSSAKDNEFCISADVMDESGMPLSTNMDIYGHDPFEKCLSLNTDETIWLEFSAREFETLLGDKEPEQDPNEAKKVKLTSSFEGEPMSSSTSDEGLEGSNWDAILDNYESAINEYIQLIQKSKNGDPNAMTKALNVQTKITNIALQLQNAGTMTSTQVNRFASLQTKMAQAAM